VIEVEGIIAGDGAVEPRFQIGRPPIAELVRAAFVIFADPRHSRVNTLKRKKYRYEMAKKKDLSNTL
jgi:hypothetical protein